MSKTEVIYSSLLLGGVFISAVSQVMLKKSAQKEYDSKIKEYLNPLVIFAYVMYVGTTFLSIIAYKGIPISMGPVLEATGYIYVMIFGITFFNEKINYQRVVAVLFIIVGIIIYSLVG